MLYQLVALSMFSVAKVGDDRYNAGATAMAEEIIRRIREGMSG